MGMVKKFRRTQKGEKDKITGGKKTTGGTSSIRMPTLARLLFPPTVRLNEHRPAAPESLGVAGTMFPDHAIAPRTLLRESVRILTFELGERLLVTVLGALLPLMFGDGVGRVEAEPLLVIRLGRHPVLLRAPGSPSEEEGASFNVHARSCKLS